MCNPILDVEFGLGHGIALPRREDGTNQEVTKLNAGCSPGILDSYTVDWTLFPTECLS
jgi:hypothetical protein